MNMKGNDKNFKSKILNKFFRTFGKWESNAKPYVEDKDKTKELLAKAIEKSKKNSGAFKDIWDSVQLLFELVKDWINGKYRDVSKQTIGLIIIGIVYFVFPLDILPDPVYIDDVTILGFIIKQVDYELRKYKKWKDNEKDCVGEGA